ncbi:SAM-dependent methyltransferase [Enterococcus saigonensis]|uniref:SAM-dependent methyltransferase n=1 Tax=Enterococcus saigonensis TaxID=1805431 RepID=A0A679ID02_9ENTE|nr:class I SAM-dependent rRNA methyltransferase [Enterococcus saigonensis]BCA86099.1 SAM-dependent methyltransferase [Enterococcus saigonensis]
MKIQMNKFGVKKLRQHYPLIQADDIAVDLTIKSDWVDFVDQKGNFLAKGYLGKQNKGIGWVLAWQDETINQAFYARIFAKAKALRQTFFNDETTTAFRIFNGEADGLGGLTIEWYDHYAVFSWYNDTLYKEKNKIVAAFKEIYPEVLGAYEKIRFAGELPESLHIYGKEAPEPLIVKENSVNFAIYLNEGLMTGIFLDQRQVRGLLVDGLAAGKTVLNMFSYTGAFSVAAAMGGALSTTSVDLAKRSLSKTREQFEVNGLDLATQKIHVMDVFNYFSYALKKGLKYDVIVLDPPSFARNKKQVFKVKNHYGQLIAESLPILTEEGIIIASANTANVTLDKFQQMIENEFVAAKVDYKLLDTKRLPTDFHVSQIFPEGNYLKVLIYQVKQSSKFKL